MNSSRGKSTLVFNTELEILLTIFYRANLARYILMYITIWQHKRTLSTAAGYPCSCGVTSHSTLPERRHPAWLLEQSLADSSLKESRGKMMHMRTTAGQGVTTQHNHIMSTWSVQGAIISEGKRMRQLHATAAGNMLRQECAKIQRFTTWSLMTSLHEWDVITRITYNHNRTQ